MVKIEIIGDSLHQWEANRQVKITGEIVDEVHFAKVNDTDALIVAPVDGVANIPDVLLQDTKNLIVYAMYERHTIGSAVFGITPRPKPQDYIFDGSGAEFSQCNVYVSKNLADVEEFFKAQAAGKLCIYMSNGTPLFGVSCIWDSSIGKRYIPFTGTDGFQRHFVNLYSDGTCSSGHFNTNRISQLVWNESTWNEYVRANSKDMLVMVDPNGASPVTATFVGQDLSGRAMFMTPTRYNHLGTEIKLSLGVYYLAEDSTWTREYKEFAFADTKLPNPYSLKLTGAVNATYDGSKAITVHIPSGGSGGSGGGANILMCTQDTTFVEIQAVIEGGGMCFYRHGLDGMGYYVLPLAAYIPDMMIMFAMQVGESSVSAQINPENIWTVEGVG